MFVHMNGVCVCSVCVYDIIDNAPYFCLFLYLCSLLCVLLHASQVAVIFFIYIENNVLTLMVTTLMNYLYLFTTLWHVWYQWLRGMRVLVVVV